MKQSHCDLFSVVKKHLLLMWAKVQKVHGQTQYQVWD